MNGGIVYDARYLRAYEGLTALGEYAGKQTPWLDALWADMLGNAGLMKEFIYYLDHHMLLDEMKCEGYALTDLYVWQMDRYNLIRDVGKNTEMCNKEAMVLNAFASMAELVKHPEDMVRRLSAGRGMDQL